MSASSKKKLRSEQRSAKMTERQRSEQKEAKKLKTYTVLFCVVLVLVLALAIWAGASRLITNSGIRERSTTALTIGEEKLNSAQLSYYYIDAINEFYSTYGSYASLFGLDLSLPLNEQVTNEETGATWADDFLESAITNAQSIYAMAAEAEANGYTLSEDEIAAIDANMKSLESYAQLYGYTSAEQYLKAFYGNGATMKSFREYTEMNALGSSYYNAYSASLEYDDAALRAAEADNYAKYSSFSYNYYYLSSSSFLEGGTTDEEGSTTYSDEEKAASVTAAEEAAKALTGEDIISLEDLDAAIAALPINADSETAVSSTACEDHAYSSVSSVILDWVTDSARTAGDKTYIANTSTTTDDEGNETTTINGYYVVYFNAVNDNNYPLANVRHILVSFEGGTYDSSTGTTTYSDEEKAAAKAKAEELLAAWESGDATEESFAELAKTESDDGSASVGGLYEDIYPGQMVTNFNDWCFDESRKPGDTGIVESTYGYHVMYYSSDSETLYRDYQIASELRSSDTAAWHDALVEAATVTEGDFSYINKAMVLSGN